MMKGKVKSNRIGKSASKFFMLLIVVILEINSYICILLIYINMRKKELNEIELQQMYESGLSCQKIADKLNVSESTISKRLKLLGVLKRTNKEYRKTKSFNENFFEYIDTESKAYWLGFFFADGTVYKHGNQSCISLKVCDKEVCDKFITAINGNFSTKAYNNRGSKIYHVDLTSDQMFLDLNKHGCVQNKSLVLQFPTISNSLISHFIRGYFDGDGSVFIINKKNYNKTNSIYTSLGISICSTFEFLTKMNSYLPIRYSINKEMRRKTNTWVLRTSGSNKAKIFLDYIYQNATIYLSRKYNKYIEYNNNKKDVQRL